MKLSKRLQCIYNMVPHGVAADDGSDHGKLIISLYKNGVISKGYAIENKKGPFERLSKAIKDENAENGVKAMLSDGVSDLPSDCDIVIIAGMGGMNIVKILKAHPQKLKNVQTIIIDAHNDIPLVRKEISSMGFVISDENMIFEDKIYYEIIRFTKGDIEFLDDPDLEFGPMLRQEKSCTFRSKYESRIKEIDNLLSTNKLPETKIHQLTMEKERIKSVL